MAKIHELVLGSKAKYKIARHEQSEDGTYWRTYVRNSSGRLEFNTLFTRDEQWIKDHADGTEIELLPWTMKIIPVHRLNKNGEVRTVRDISGLAFDEAQATQDSERNAQNIYDDSERTLQVGVNAEVKKVAKAGYFVNFIDRSDFIELMEGLD